MLVDFRVIPREQDANFEGTEIFIVGSVTQDARSQPFKDLDMIVGISVCTIRYALMRKTSSKEHDI